MDRQKGRTEKTKTPQPFTQKPTDPKPDSKIHSEKLRYEHADEIYE
ncbi:hypothetical protein AB6A23_12755 [Paenibacillus tarimensis]